MKAKTKASKGLKIIFTGNGKGKTSAALGVAVRAAGYGYKTLMVKFIKGTIKSGEDLTASKLSFMRIIRAGKGFYKIMGDELPPEEHRKAALKGLQMALKMAKSKKYQLVILDEINVALSVGLLTFTQIKRFVQSKPESIHLIMTGRNAPKGLIKMADMVTEMKDVKHPFRKGFPAVPGIDY